MSAEHLQHQLEPLLGEKSQRHQPTNAELIQITLESGDEDSQSPPADASSRPHDVDSQPRNQATCEPSDMTQRTHHPCEDALNQVGRESLPHSSENMEIEREGTLMVESSGDARETNRTCEDLPIYVDRVSPTGESESQKIGQPPSYDDVCMDGAAKSSSAGKPPPYDLQKVTDRVRQPRHSRDRVDVVHQQPRRSQPVDGATTDVRPVIAECCTLTLCLLCCAKTTGECITHMILCSFCCQICSALSSGNIFYKQ